jgi:hypothetical protein
MQSTMRWFSSFLLILLCHTFAAGDLKVQSGDRWPQNPARALAVGQGHLFLSRGNVLTILDSDLSPVSSIDLQVEILGIFYAGGFIYAATGRTGLMIIDVSTPSTPELKGNPYVPEDNSGVGSVFVSGNNAFVISFTQAFRVIDVSEPSDPKKIGETTLGALFLYPVNLSVSGGRAAVADQVNGLHLLDVSNPLKPAWKSLTVIPGAGDVALSGNYAYVASASEGMTILQVDSLTDPIRRGHFTAEDPSFSGVTVSGHYAYMADEKKGLVQLNIADPDHPVMVRSFAGTRGAYSSATHSGDIFVCDFTYGLQKIAGGDRTATYNPPAGARNLFVDERLYLYVVSGAAGSESSREGLRILDAFNPGNFLLKGFLTTPGQAHAVHAAGDYAYVADGEGGLLIIDVGGREETGTFTPVITGSLGNLGNAQDVYVSGDYAYMATTGGMRIVDVADKTNPVGRGSVHTTGAAYAVVASRGLAYVAAGSDGLQIIDPADPDAPVLIQSLALPGNAYDVAVSGNYAYVAAGAAGLQIIDISNPSSPLLTGSSNTAGNATGIHIYGDYARVADGAGGLVTLDISNPEEPLKVDEWSFPTSGDALKVCSYNEYVFVAEDLGGAAVYKLSDVSPFTPVPYNPPGGGRTCFIGNLFGRQPTRR